MFTKDNETLLFTVYREVYKDRWSAVLNFTDDSVSNLCIFHTHYQHNSQNGTNILDDYYWLSIFEGDGWPSAYYCEGEIDYVRVYEGLWKPAGNSFYLSMIDPLIFVSFWLTHNADFNATLTYCGDGDCAPEIGETKISCPSDCNFVSRQQTPILRHAFLFNGNLLDSVGTAMIVAGSGTVNNATYVLPSNGGPSTQGGGENYHNLFIY